MIDPLYMRPSFDEMAAREQLESALVTPAGRIVVSSSSFGGADQAPGGQAAGIEPLVEATDSAGAVTTQLLPSGGEQVAAAVPVDGWPLVAVANVDHAEVVAQSKGVFRGMLGAALAVIVAAVLIVVARLSVRHARRFANPA